MAYNWTWAIVILLSLFILLLSGALLGRRFAQWQIANRPDHRVEIISVAEGAVFALLGLLIAFTFTGAYDRFEGRKLHIIEEVNAIDTTYLRIGMLPPAAQAPLRDTLKKYVDIRLDIYKKYPDLMAAAVDFENLRMQRYKFWNEAVAAVQATGSQATTMLLLDSINKLFDIANLRISIMQIHPPLSIFALLVGLAIMSTFLAGYATASVQNNYSVHILGYVVICALTIYVIIDLEMPRIGLINVNAFDQNLIQARAEMQ